MKKQLLTLTLAAGSLLASGLKAQSLPTSAASLKYNVAYLHDVSMRMGDYGYAMNDLANLRAAADRFYYTLQYQDYQNLRFAYDTSTRSWPYLQSFRYERIRYTDVERDMYVITQNMERPLPPPPPPGPRIITVSGQGSGGTTHGDRNAACEKATERALFDVANTCSRQRGELLSSSAGSCGCTRQRGDDYTCRVNAQGSCRISTRFRR